MLREDLEQRKLFGKKYMITGQAINKAIDFEDLKQFTHEENEMIRECIKKVLFLAMTENDSNEVAVAMSKDKIGNNYGTHHGVDLDASYHMQDIVNLLHDFTVLFHNHPSTQTFSLEDLQYFMHHSRINVFGVVTNQGQVAFLSRGRYVESMSLAVKERAIDEYWKKLKCAVKECSNDISSKESYLRCKRLLKQYKKYGLYFRVV